MKLSHRSDEQLLTDVARLIGSHRHITAKLVVHLGEIEDRRLHLKAGFASMFEFCRKKLGLGEGEAFRRIVAARLIRRFPVVESLLASGAVHLSALELLSRRLTQENHADLLAAASGKGKREVEALLALRFPRPDVPSSIRKLPDPAGGASAADVQRPTPSASSTAAFALEPSGNLQVAVSTPTRIEQLSEARFRIEFTASTELREKLELCRDLMSHANPSRELGVVFERAVDLLLVDLQTKRLARARRPRGERGGRRANSDRAARSVRRQVFERDGLQCTYVASDGRRCEARAFLELDHADPRALGGGDDVENLRVRCRAHNQLWAEEVYGREHVERARHFRQKKCEQRHGPAKHEAPSTIGASVSVLEKVHFALRKMGFESAQARLAVLEVQRAHDEPLPVEQALREALSVATARFV